MNNSPHGCQRGCPRDLSTYRWIKGLKEHPRSKNHCSTQGTHGTADKCAFRCSATRSHVGKPECNKSQSHAVHVGVGAAQQRALQALEPEFVLVDDGLVQACSQKRPEGGPGRHPNKSKTHESSSNFRHFDMAPDNFEFARHRGNAYLTRNCKA